MRLTVHADRLTASAVSAQAAGLRPRAPAHGRAQLPAPGGPGRPCAPICALSHEAPARRRPVAEDVYLRAFWHCFRRLEDQADEMVGKAAYFRFLTLLGARPAPLAPRLPE